VTPPPAPEPAGPVVQAAPPELPARTSAPILPPLTPPQQPSWKQEIKEGGPEKESQ
jgi:hypothetical protein